jgi:predicted transcriptional regulator
MKYMPQEIEVWYVIPAIRRELAKEMARSKLKQKDIAKLLGLTEPAVSQYLKSKRAKDIKFEKIIQSRINVAAHNIMKDNKNMIFEIQDICEKVRKSGSLCKIACKYHDLQENCCVCMN